ncbi:MAG: GtrA family protein [Hyphomicrobiales bacterium]|nr:GtrA family protein [Hyphomicrobiales bacterium]
MSELSLKRSIVAFIVVGIAAAMIHYATLWTLVEQLKMPLIGGANAIAAIVGILSSYIGNRLFVFPTGQRTRETMPRFFATYGTALALHSVLMTLWADILALAYTPGFILITGLVAVINYLTSRFLVFRKW